MSFIELALAIALGIAIAVLAPIVILGLVTRPFSIIVFCDGYYQDRKKEKELISRGAKNIKVKNGIIYQAE